jgi:hypothetical protein
VVRCSCASEAFPESARPLPVRWFRLVCDDPVEHRRRVENRVADLPGFPAPTWSQVSAWQTERWDEDHVLVHTTGGNPATTLMRALGRPG